MEEKKYKTMSWAKAPRALTLPVMEWIGATALDDINCRKVSCDLCDVVLWESISHTYWKSRLTAKEQRHMDSEQHQTNVILKKLAND